MDGCMHAMGITLSRVICNVTEEWGALRYPFHYLTILTAAWSPSEVGWLWMTETAGAGEKEGHPAHRTVAARPAPCSSLKDPVRQVFVIKAALLYHFYATCQVTGHVGVLPLDKRFFF